MLRSGLEAGTNRNGLTDAIDTPKARDSVWQKAYQESSFAVRQEVTAAHKLGHLEPLSNPPLT